MAGTRFPSIKSQTPYVLTLGSHNIHWFTIGPETAATTATTDYAAPLLSAPPALDLLLDGALSESFESRLLPAYLNACRWFGGKTRDIRACRVAERIPVTEDARIILIDLTYFDGGIETYLLPLQIASGTAAAPFARKRLRRLSPGLPPRLPTTRRSSSTPCMTRNSAPRSLN